MLPTGGGYEEEEDEDKVGDELTCYLRVAKLAARPPPTVCTTLHADQYVLPAGYRGKR